MFVPFDEERGLHPQDQDFLEHQRWDFEDTPPDKYPLLLHYPYFQLYRKQVVKQADLVLAMHWRGDAFTPEQKHANFDYYERLTVRDSSLSASTQSVLAAEVGHLDARARLPRGGGAAWTSRTSRTTRATGCTWPRSPGAVLAAVAGFGGVRDYGGRLSLPPAAPGGHRAAALLAGGARDRAARVEIAPGRDRATRCPRATRCASSHWGEEVTLGGGGAVQLPIPPHEGGAAPSPPPGREPRAGRSRKDWPQLAALAGAHAAARRPTSWAPAPARRDD